MPPDHSRSRSDSSSSPEVEPKGLIAELPVPGISTGVGSFTVRPAAFWKFSMSLLTMADWPTMAMVWPTPVLPDWISEVMPYTVLMSPGAKKTRPLWLEVKLGCACTFLGRITCGRGRKSSRLRTVRITGARADGMLNSVEGAKCCTPSALK